MQRNRLPIAALAGSAALILALVGCSPSNAEPAAAVGSAAPLRMGAIATGTAPEEKARYERTAEELSKALDGREVEVVTSTDYYAIVEGLRGGKLDIGFINSLGYVVAKGKVDVQPLAAGMDEDGRTGYFSYLITGTPDIVRGPEDLRGKRLALSSKLSTSGYLFPLDALTRAGIDPAKDTVLAAGGNHAANILAVASGQVDAAFVDSVEYDSAVERGKVDPAAATKVWTSMRITGSPVVARPDMPAEEREEIRQALLSLRGTEDHRIGVEKSLQMTEARDEDYEPIRELAEASGITIDDFRK
jgi:phosphonate transport system substrate-binding protein